MSRTFLMNFLRHPTRVGAIAPSSPALVKEMIDSFDWSSVRHVVEYGPGTGVFTESILKKLHPDGKFFAIERSAALANLTRQRCDQAIVCEASAADVESLCRAHDMSHVDAIVCGLPWAAFPESLQEEIMDATLRVLRPGGVFATFAYWQGIVLPAGQRFSKRLKRTFTSVSKSQTAWLNLPPAFVYRCVR